MKNTKILLMALVAVSAVFAVSCTPAQQVSDYGYDQRPVYNSPYGSNVIVVERDPYTGRYYQVNPNNGYYLNDPYYNNRNYSGGYYDPYYNNRTYSNRRYDRRVYSNNNTNTEVRKQPTEDEKNEAKDKVFGRRRN